MKYKSKYLKSLAIWTTKAYMLICQRITTKHWEATNVGVPKEINNENTRYKEFIISLKVCCRYLVPDGFAVYRYSRARRFVVTTALLSLDIVISLKTPMP